MLILAVFSIFDFSAKTNSPSDIFWMIMLPLSYVLCLFFYIFSLMEKRIRLQNESLAKIQISYLKTQLDAMQDLQLQETEISKKRHDLKKHMAIIETLAEDGNYKELKKYTSELADSFPVAKKPISGNNIADIIISKRMEIAMQKGIDFKFNGSLSGISGMPAPDICSLLSNALDNAIEACENVENPYLYVDANSTKYFTSVSVRNPVIVKRHIHGNKISSTKKDKKSHGYGITIMQEIANKYHGKCLISCSQLEFSLRIQLQNP